MFKSIFMILTGCILVTGNLRAQELVLADSPVAVTSFGAAVCGDYLYVYGGNEPASTWSLESQNPVFRRLKLSTGAKWEALGEVPRRQSNALVSYHNKLYRLGGFEARNTSDQQIDLHSSDEFLMYDPAISNWQELAAMPEPRSDFDAVVLGDFLYVVGGRSIKGSEMSWLKTAWKIDLSDPQSRWKPIKHPSILRRGNSIGHFQGKVYVIGGWVLHDEGQSAGPTTGVTVFDPNSDSWTEGPELPKGQGFGSSTCNVGGTLIVSTMNGQILKLAEDAANWEEIHQLDPGRYLHRLVVIDDHRFVVLGGSSEKGSPTDVPVFDLHAMPDSTPPQSAIDD